MFRAFVLSFFDDEMIAGLVLSRLHQTPNAILDGFPRTLKQAEIMLSRGEKIDVIAEMIVPIEEVQKRLFLRGRDQDTKEIIEERFRVYEQSKDEIVAFLVGNGAKLVKIDGLGTQDEVYARAIQILKEAI